MTTEQKLELIASLIVDRIVDDQNNGTQLLKQIEGSYVASRTTAA